MKYLLILTLVMHPSMPPQHLQNEVSSVQECLSEAEKFLKPENVQGMYGISANCVMIMADPGLEAGKQ